MAQSLTPLKDAVHKILVTKLQSNAESQHGMYNVCSPLFETKAEVQVNDIAVSAGFSTKTGVGVPTPQDIRALSAKSAPIIREKNHRFEKHRLLDYDRLAADIVDICWVQAWNEIDAAVFTLLGAGRTTAHPDNGVSGSPYAANGGGTVYVVDNFDMTFLDGTTATQTNDATLAFGADNLSTRLNTRRGFKSLSGKPDLELFEPVLVVGDGISQLAGDLVEQSGRFYTGAGAEPGFKGRVTKVVIAPAASGWASNAWALVYVKRQTAPNGGEYLKGPVYAHIREIPVMKIEEVQGSSDINVYTNFHYSVFYGPCPDHSLFYSKPT